MPATIEDVTEGLTEGAKVVPIAGVRVGHAGRLAVTGACDCTLQRLMAMGLLPGAQVKVIRIAPLGDPIVLQTSGFQVSLRKAEAKGLAIELGA
ncbi:MAG: FeoA domain-containing protein [Phycisphaeraceae bacterium]